MRYIDLMGGQKPHLLVTVKNNLGAETRIHYAPSTKFYLQDKHGGKPWMTRLALSGACGRARRDLRLASVAIVSSPDMRTITAILTATEREFRGFGMVEQLDTEEFTALSAEITFPAADNVDAASHVPPVYTKTWFHTGAFVDRRASPSNWSTSTITRASQAPREQNGTTTNAARLLPDDTVLPTTIHFADSTRRSDVLTADEVQEACRALKGKLLRQEIYALDETAAAERPYATSERNYTIEPLQPWATNRHAVFFSHAREQIDFHYERRRLATQDGHIVDEATAASLPDVHRVADHG